MKWIKEKIFNFLTLPSIHAQLSRQANELNKLREVIKERTAYHLDIHSYAKNNSQVILIGKYRNRDFVKCYSIPDQEFDYLINHCKELEKYSTIGKVDALPEITSVMKNYFE